MLDLGVPDLAAPGITGTSTGSGHERLLVARFRLPWGSLSKVPAVGAVCRRRTRPASTPARRPSRRFRGQVIEPERRRMRTAQQVSVYPDGYRIFTAP